MKKRFLLSFAVVLACGCSPKTSERKALDGKIDEIVSSVNNGKERYKSLDNLNDLLSRLRKCEDREMQSRMAREFAERMVNAYPRLEGSDYSPFVVEVRRFGLNVGYVITTLEEFEPDASLRISFYSKLLERYKNLSFSIPWTACGTGESRASFELRMNSAQVLLCEYLEDAASWKRFTFPRIKGRLPLALRAEFEKQASLLLTYPTRDDFMRSPMMTGVGRKLREGMLVSGETQNVDSSVSHD